MRLRRNANMEYIEVDDSNLVVFDPESGDTHFIDEVGSDIVNNLANESTFDDLLLKLCEIYKTERQEIECDVTEFLQQLIDKKVVKSL